MKKFKLGEMIKTIDERNKEVFEKVLEQAENFKTNIC